jgi:outer membrane protein
MQRIYLLLCIPIFLVSPELKSQETAEWTLGKCIDMALGRNIQVRKGTLTVQKAGVNLSQSKAQRLPSLSGSASQNFSWEKDPVTGSSSFSGSNSSSFSVYGGIDIFSGFRTANLIKQSELQIQSSGYALETIRESISLNVLDAYLQVLYAQERVNNSIKQIESTEEELRLAKERLELRVITAADYTQVKAQLSSEKLTLANARSQLSLTLISLKQLMELPADTAITLARPDLGQILNDHKMPDAASVFETALVIKPQIRNAGLNKQIAGLDRKIAESGYFPTLSASAGVSTAYSGLSDVSYMNQLNDGIRPTAGLTLSIPIYQRRQVKTNVETAKLNFNDAELSETDTRNQLRKSIEQACQDVLSARSEYAASLENYEAMKESIELSKEKFEQGIINSVDYMVSKTNLILAESQLLQSKYNLIFSYKVLDFYEGVPLSL